MIGQEFGKVKVNKEAQKSEKKVSWNSKSVQRVKDLIEKGLEPPKVTPFYHRTHVNWRKPDLIFDYTKEEKEEIRKCKSDIIYFVETHCQLMTDYGYTHIKLRPYQKVMLRNFQKSRNNIVLSSRQIGKCFSFKTKINTIQGKVKIKIYNFLDGIKNRLLIRNERKNN